MKDMTLINVILDRSGSMASISEEAVSLFNVFLDEQQKLPDYAELSLVQFDNLYEENYIRKPIKECKHLIDGETYQPRGLTALYDAIGKCIATIGNELKALPREERPRRVLFMILTDGYENDSKEYNSTAVKSMIEHQTEKYSWDFIFLAAGIDSFSQGAMMGLSPTKCASYSRSAQGMAAANHTMSSYATVYRSSGDNTAKVDDHVE